MSTYENQSILTKKAEKNNCSTYEITKTNKPQQQTSLEQENTQPHERHTLYNFNNINSYNNTTTNPDTFEMGSLISQIDNPTNGEPLDSKTKTNMENELNYNFSSVRVHTDNYANNLTNALNAKATCYGNNIYFAKNQYNPNTKTGTSLLKHELNHQQQQNLSRIKQIQNQDETLPQEPEENEQQESQVNDDFVLKLLQDRTPFNLLSWDRPIFPSRLLTLGLDPSAELLSGSNIFSTALDGIKEFNVRRLLNMRSNDCTLQMDVQIVKPHTSGAYITSPSARVTCPNCTVNASLDIVYFDKNMLTGNISWRNIIKPRFRVDATFNISGYGEVGLFIEGFIDLAAMSKKNRELEKLDPSVPDMRKLFPVGGIPKNIPTPEGTTANISVGITF
ncbi:MAG: DUF4157 domain-containing protein [Candidatus Bathyarchaeota archaeon]|nr:DUF4157 domain-containing protein [Candidatus Termiticorpusculum sp.]